MTRIFFVAIIITTVGLQRLDGEEPKPTSSDLTVAEFLKLGSCHLSEKGGHKAFLVISDVDDPPIRYRQVLAWKAPNNAALLVLDGSDNTPMLAVADGHAIFYDPEKMQIYTSANMGVNFGFKLEGKSFESRVGMKSGRNNLIDIDFGSFLRGATEDIKIVKEGVQSFTFDGSSKSGRSRCRAVVNRQATIPLQQFDLFTGGNDQLTISFARIDGDPSLDSAFFGSPVERVKGLAIPTKALEAEEFLMSGWSPLRVALFRMAVADPKIRRELEGQLSQGLNWDNARRQEAKASKALRDKFVTPFKDLGIQQDGAD